MRIVMMTNTFLPHTGGVARSVASFSEAFLARGHRVTVIAPTFEGESEAEPDVIRVPAVQNFNGSDFSVRLPIPGFLTKKMDHLQPDVIHSHHPFLLGHTALRIAAMRNLPIVFTHHTMYERYTHYVPADSMAMKRFAIQLATDYANSCDQVIAPSESIGQILKERGVTTPIRAIPTGIDQAVFRHGDGQAARSRYEIPGDAFVVGHVGRLAPEKNLAFLTRAVADFLEGNKKAHFLLIGDGPDQEMIRSVFQARNLSDRFHHPQGALDGQNLTDAYHAMDVFAFASHTETQGMVLAEAMTAGVPVVAIDAPGVREIVRDGVNGHLLPKESEAQFVEALADLAFADEKTRARQSAAARDTAEEFSMDRCATKMLELYEECLQRASTRKPPDDAVWATLFRRIEEEWMIWSGVGRAVSEAILPSEEKDPGEV